MKKMFLVDAYALIFKYYYAFLYSPMRSPDGQNTSAIFGFVKFLGDIISKQKPDCLAVAFDLSGGTFRNELYPQYKANREETPEDIVYSAKVIKEILSAMHIHILEKQGWEADDILGTISKRAAATGEYEVYIVSPDKDLSQLVDDRISIYRPGKSGKPDEILGRREICEQYGISDPRQIIDILAIWGDAADNIPGVNGIGEKGAAKLLSEWGDLENIIANVDKLKPKQAENIKASVDQLRLARKLTEIALNVPIEIQCSDMALKEPDNDSLSAIYKRLGFRSMMPTVQSAAPDQQLEKKYVQKSLFDDDIPLDDPVPVQKPKTIVVAPEPEPVPDESAVYSRIGDIAHTYSHLTDENGVNNLIVRIREKGRFAFDTETTSVEPMRAKFVGMSVCVQAHEAYWIDDPQLVRLFTGLFSSKEVEKIGHNVKYDILVLKNTLGIDVAGRLWDTMIMHYILYPESRHNMDYLSASILGYEPVHIEEVIGKGASQMTMDMADPQKVLDYAAEDADVTFRLFEELYRKVTDTGKMSLYTDIEEPLIRVLAEMEFNGVSLDVEKLGEISSSLSGRVSQFEREILEIAGEPGLNINSAKQLGIVLYEKLKIDPNPKMTKQKSYKTDEETLQKLKTGNPIVSKILDYRGLKKLLSTYVDALPKLINPATGRIHTSFNQAVTATGRLSSSNPNLQNIPVRDDDGREIRKAFIAGEKGWRIVSADYSQVELRIMAHMSQDKHMLSAFKSGEDIHAATAAKIFHKQIEDVTKEERGRAKAANFGIIYGISSFGLSERMGMSVREAKQFIDDYYLSFPEVRRFIDNSVAEAKVRGYVTTIFGRHRELPEIKSANAAVRKFAERNAVNAPIQGSAADIMKIAMTRVSTALHEKNLRARILLQIHDELVLEVPQDEVEAVRSLLVEGMSNAASLSVPLDVEVGVGDNWLDAH